MMMMMMMMVMMVMTMTMTMTISMTMMIRAASGSNAPLLPWSGHPAPPDLALQFLITSRKHGGRC